MAVSRRITIVPDDASYLAHALVLVALQVGVASICTLHPADYAPYTVVRTGVVSLFSAGTFLLLQTRHMTLQRACSLRVARTHVDYTAATARAVILTASGMSTIFGLVLVTSALAHLPLVHARLVDADSMLLALTAALGWWAAAMNVTVCIACIAMALTQDPVKFTFDEPVDPTAVPLETNKISQANGAWTKIASTSRRHDVYVRRSPETGSSRQSFDVTTRLASNHPLYAPERDASASGPTLRITL